MQISKFKLDSNKMIQTLDDALVSLTVGETEDDLVNQVRFPSAEFCEVEANALAPQ